MVLNRRRVLTALVGASAAGALAEMRTGAQSVAHDAIATASRTYGVSESWLLDTALCETAGTMDPGSDNGAGDHGLFAFKDATFYAYCSGSPWNAYDAADCAAYMFSIGLCTHWCCSGCHPNPCD